MEFMQQVAEQAAEMGGDLKKFNRYVYPSMRRTQVIQAFLLSLLLKYRHKHCLSKV